MIGRFNVSSVAFHDYYTPVKLSQHHHTDDSQMTQSVGPRSRSPAAVDPLLDPTSRDSEDSITSEMATIRSSPKPTS